LNSPILTQAQVVVDARFVRLSLVDVLIAVFSRRFGRDVQN
jgi:hypothetical protein